MPLKDWGLQATWEDQYSVRIRDSSHPLFGQRVTYGRILAQRMTDPYTDELTEYNQRVSHLTTLFPIQTADRILVGGCGFGYLIEAFKDAGYANCWGIDSSPWISTNKGTEARGDVLMVDADIRGGGVVKTALRNLTGDSEFTWIISEHVMEWHDDIELDGLLNAAEVALERGSPNSNIIHIVLTLDTNDGQIVDFNLKTLVDWNAIRPDHSWVNGVTWEVL